MAFTLDIYSHVLPQVDAEAAELIATFVERDISPLDVVYATLVEAAAAEPVTDRLPTSSAEVCASQGQMLGWNGTASVEPARVPLGTVAPGLGRERRRGAVEVLVDRGELL